MSRVHGLGWIDSKQLDSDGQLKPCTAPQCGGFTLEAELDLKPRENAKNAERGATPHPGPLPDRGGEGEFFCVLCVLLRRLNPCPSVFIRGWEKMSDVFTKSKRSEVMSRIRSRGNRDTELALAGLLRAHRITGWRRHAALKFQVSGSKFQVKPDFVWKEVRLALFVDGCFWHGCPKHATKPKQNAAFWRKKLAANKARDRRVNRALRRTGWRVVRVWEHELQQSGKRKAGKRKCGGRGNIQPPTAVVRRILRAIRDRSGE